MLLLTDEDPDDPDHPTILRDRELRVPHADVFRNLRRRSLRGIADDFGMGEEVRGYRD